MTLTLEALQRVIDDADLLLPKHDIDRAIEQLAAKITQELKDEMPVVYSIMNGGLVFAGQLLTQLDFPLEQGYMHATRYRNETKGASTLQWQAPPSIPMNDRTVLILDDIFDEGHTLAEVVNACKKQGAKRVLTAVLLNKVHDRKSTDLQIDFIGTDVEDRFLFGFGMDYQGYWRNAPAIYAVKGL